MTLFKPMLATDADLDKLRFPVYASPKLDGIRASIVDGRLLTRTLKEVPNRFVYNALSDHKLTGLDGELIVGPASSPTVYRDTVSGVMSRDGVPQATYWVFDLHDQDGWPYADRYDHLVNVWFGRDDLTSSVKIDYLAQTLITDEAGLQAYEEQIVGLGFEGVILRSIDSPYKFGRSTVKEGYLLKLKRFCDSEAEILEVIEEMHNGNEATTNELGRTKRSSHQENKTGKQRMGALLVRDIQTGVEFQIGTGFTDLDKQQFWLSDHRGMVVKYKYFPVGVKDKPRHPVYLGLRHKDDL